MEGYKEGESFSRLMTQQKQKPIAILKMKGSFQQLYDLLSKQTAPIYQATRKKCSTYHVRERQRNNNPKLNINVEYSFQSAQLNKSSKIKLQLHNYDSSKGRRYEMSSQDKLEWAEKNRRKKNIDVEKTNQKLKSIIFGNRRKTSSIYGRKESNKGLSAQIQVIDKDQKKKRSVTQVTKKKQFIEQYIEETRKQIKKMKENGNLSQHLKEMPNQISSKIQYQEKDLLTRLRSVRLKKKLNIKGQQLSNHAIGSKDVEPDSKKSKGNKSNKLSPCNSLDKIIMPCQSTSFKKQELQQLIAQYCSEQLVSEHILQKTQKLFDFYDEFLSTFLCHLNTKQSLDLPKYSRRNHFNFFYVGPGNNRNLILDTLSKRWWWKESKNADLSNFVWTQQKNLNLLISIAEKIGNANNFGMEIKDSNQRVKKDDLKMILSTECMRKKQMLFVPYKHKKQKKNLNNFESKLTKPPPCLHNHLRNGNILGDKKSLFQLIKMWNMEYKNMKRSELFKFIPETFHIQSQSAADFELFSSRFQQLEHEKDNLWIVKPGENSNRGRNIFITSSFLQISQAIKSRAQQSGTTIIQKYKSDLLLYKGRKFDIRTFLLCIIIGGHRKFYWYANGYIRTSSHQFNIKDLNSMIHLTNDAIQNQGDQYGKFQKGNKLSYSQLQSYLKQSFPQRQWKMQDLIHRMKDIAKKVAKASYGLIDDFKDQYGFELFGMDFIVDSEFTPWLLQINTNPCLQLSSPLLKALIPSLIENVFRLAVDPLFPPTMFPDKEHQYSIPEKIIESNKFQLLFDSVIERDEEWQRFCGQKNIIKLTGQNQ